MATPGADSGGAHESAERAYLALDEAHRLVARGLLLRLVSLDGDDGGRRLPLIDLQDTDRAAALARVLSVLERTRVIAVDGPEIMLADPALARTWPRLRGWIEQETSVLAIAHRTIDAAQVWVQERFPATRLLRGERLKAALGALRDGDGDLLGPTARMFVLKSLERQRWWKRKLLRRRIALVGVLVLVLGTISAVSVAHRQGVERNAALRSQRLIAAAKAAATTDPDLAVQFAVAAYRASPSPQAIQLMYGMLGKPAGQVAGDTGSPILRVAVRGNLAATVSQNGSLRIWNLAVPGAPQVLATIRAHPAGLAFTPNGRLLAASCATKDLCLWNLADPRHPTVAGRLPMPGHWQKTGVTRMAISPDGTLLAAATLSGHTPLWSIAQPGKPRLLHEFVTPAGGPLNDHLASVAFAPRGERLAITVQRNGAAGQGGHGGTELWNVADGAHPSSVAKIAGGYQSVAFSPNGSLLAAGGNTKVALWRLDRTGHPAPTGARPTCAANPSGGETDVESIAFSPDGGRLAYGGTDSLSGNTNATVCLLDVSAASLYAKSPVATSVPTRYGTPDVTYTPDGTLFTGGNDGVARLWRFPVPQIGGLRTDGTSSWDVSGDGRLLAAPIAPAGPLSSPSSFGIWDISSPGGPVLDAMVPLGTELISFLNGRQLLTVAKGGAVGLWNLADPGHPVRAASLGTTATVAPGGFSGMVATDQAADLVSVLDGTGRLHLWKITRGPGAREAGSLPATNPADGFAAVLADGRTALSVTATGVTWWNVADPAHPVRGDTSPLTDGLGTAEGGGGLVGIANRPAHGGATLRLFHLDRGRLASAVTVSRSAGTQVRISQDTRLLAATVNVDSALTLWDITDPAHPRRRTSFAVPYVAGLALSPTDRRLADWNRTTVQLWDIHHPAAPVAHASLVPPRATADDPVTGARFSTSGSTLYAATTDAVFVYDADPAALANRLCSVTGRPVTRAQWRRYVPGIPYENPCPR